MEVFLFEDDWFWPPVAASMRRSFIDTFLFLLTLLLLFWLTTLALSKSHARETLEEVWRWRPTSSSGLISTSKWTSEAASHLAIQGCRMTASASILRLASRTRRRVMRSLASAETPAQPCCSRKTTSPCWMARKRRLWQLAHSASPVSQPQSGSSQRPAANGRYPLSRQYAITPKDHRSHLLS